MKNFQYYAPTKVLFGKDTETKVGELILEQIASPKVLIHYGSNSAKKSGLLDRVEKSLKDAGINFISLGGVVPNPRISLAREGIALCQKEHVNFILAVGGGSVIDSAKAIGYGLANPEVDVWDIYDQKYVPTGCAPIGVILTIAAAGSEMSNSSVLTNEDGLLKRGYNSEYSRCKFAILNPELTMSLPMYQTQSGCVDILMHTLERYFGPERSFVKEGASSVAGVSGGEEGVAELTDSIAEALMKTLIHNALILKEQPSNYNARAEVMWASSLSHNGLTACGGSGDWASHQMEHEIGGMFDVAHGAGLAAIWGSWARYVYKDCPDRFAQFAQNVMGVKNADNLALAGIEALENLFRKIEMPTSLTELGVKPTDEQIAEMALKCSYWRKRKVGGFHPLDVDDMIAIYTMAK